MTSVIGIHCKDGIVIAADSALTIAGSIEQPYSEKITRVHDDLIVGFAGDLGFAQRFKNTLESNWKAYQTQNPQASAFDLIKNCSAKGIQEYFSTFQYNNYLPTQQQLAIPTEFLVAFAYKNQHHLVAYPAGHFQPLLLNDHFWYISIGSGSSITNPFLGFIREVFWEDNQSPSLNNGIFSAVMALRLAIKINPGGVNGPINIVTIRKNDSETYESQVLHNDEISQHEENVKEAIKYFKKYETIFESTEAPDIPQP